MAPPLASSARSRARRSQKTRASSARERDLLDDEAGDEHREGRPGDQAGQHQHHRQRPDVGGEEAVQGDCGRVGGEHEAVRNRGAGEGGADDRVPGQRRQRGLHGLQRGAGDDRPDADPCQAKLQVLGMHL
jgi:hypothetical protein